MFLRVPPKPTLRARNITRREPMSMKLFISTESWLSLLRFYRRFRGPRSNEVEGFANAARECAGTVWFSKDRDSAFHHFGQCSRFVAIACNKKDSNATLYGLDRFIDFRSAATRHDNVQQDESDGVAVSGKHFHGF